jgi:hypothetical protein
MAVVDARGITLSGDLRRVQSAAPAHWRADHAGRGAAPHVRPETAGAGLSGARNPGYVRRMAVNADYRRFLSEWSSTDSANANLDVRDPAPYVWMRDIARPWWESMSELARVDGFRIETFEARRPHETLGRELHTPCARLVMPDGTPYHPALLHSQIQEAAYRDYGERVVVAARERHRQRMAAVLIDAEKEPYASPLFAWPERRSNASRLPWRRMRVPRSL